MAGEVVSCEAVIAAEEGVRLRSTCCLPEAPHFCGLAFSRRGCFWEHCLLLDLVTGGR